MTTMALILPKGIVVNAPGISSDIERKNGEPMTAEEIAMFWKVYTTTKRRLLDPTAERLENHWWRIWGSRKFRELSSATVAKLFSDISAGYSVVPLRGPANRYEADRFEPREQTTGQLREAAGTASSTTMHSPTEDQGFGRRKSSTAAKQPAYVLPPILKKSRGPSATGPRPTARFVSPHSSEEEAVDSPNSRVIVRPPTPESRPRRNDRRAVTPTSHRKKTHGVTTHKRRPMLLRKPNSQSSTGSDAAAPREQESAPVLSLDEDDEGDSTESQQEIMEESSALGNSQNHSKFVENFSLSPGPRSHVIASQTVDQISNRRSKPPCDTCQIPSPTQNTNMASESSVHFQPKENGRGLPLDKDSFEKEICQDSESQSRLLADGKARLIASERTANRGIEPRTTANEVKPATIDSTFRVENKSPRSKVETAETAGRQVHSLNHTTIVDSKSSVSLAPTLTAATGELDVSDNLANSEPESRRKGKEKETQTGNGSGASLFMKRPVRPIARAASALFPSPTKSTPPAINGTPLSRSKSQLTLLLERDRERTDAQKGKPNSKATQRSAPAADRD